MKRKLLLVGFCLTMGLFAAKGQNKTLGVGVTTPNPNAALHVESPTNNQGFIMPRLTTAQRTGFAAVLTAADEGLMVYDSDLNTIYIWDGTVFKSTAQVAGGAKLTYPYIDSVTNTTGTNDLFKLQYNNSEQKRLMRLEHLDPAQTASTLSVLQMGTGIGGYFSVNNATNGGTALYGTTNSNLGGALAPVGVYGESTGIGSLGGSFRNTNAANTYPALFAENNGLANAVSFHNINASNQKATLYLNTNGTVGSDAAASAGLLAETSTAFSAIVGRVPSGTSNAITGISNSTNAGSFAILGTNNGAGPAGVFSINNNANTSNALDVTTNGKGVAGKFVVNNTSAQNPAIWGQANSDSLYSSPVYGLHTGTGDAAGVFRINNPSNSYSAVYGETNGGGPAVFGGQIGTGRAGQFQITNSANTNAAIRSFTQGTGNSGFFTINNPASASAGIFSTTNGTGGAIVGQNTGSGNGMAGFFENTNAANTYPAIQAATAGSGSGVRVMQTTGPGPGMDVYMQNSSSTANGFVVDQGGLGSAAFLNTTNASNTVSALNAQTAGTGSAGNFSISNPASGAATIFSQTAGTGAAIQGQTSTGWTAVYGRREGTSNGNAGAFEIVDGANSYPALQATTIGSGSAGNFVINNGSNADNAVNGNSNGVGSVFSGYMNGTGRVASFTLDNTGSNTSAVIISTNATGSSHGLESFHNGVGDAIYAQANSGSAGNFNNVNNANTASTLFAMTNAANGHALGLINSAEGSALTIFQGGMKISTASLAGGGTINQRAVAYNIDTNTYNFGFSLAEGDIFYIHNSGGAGNATVAGISVPSGTSVTLIFLGGALRSF